MTFRFSKNETIILVAALILVIGLIVAGYFLHLGPKKDDIESSKATLKSEQQVLSALQEQKPKETELTLESIAMLQKKVPVKPQLEQLLLDLEKAETISGSRIKSFTFTEGEVSGPKQTTQSQQEQNKEEDNAEGEQTPDGNEQENGEEGAENEPIPEPVEYIPPVLPEGMKKLSVSITVESLDDEITLDGETLTGKTGYDKLQDFIQSLESLQRTIVVETISFQGKDEVTSEEDEVDPILTCTINLSAFFMPSLTELQEKLPELITPQPGDKTFPFYQSPDL